MCLFCPVKNHSFDYPPCLGSSALTPTLRIRRRALQIQREERVPLIGTHSQQTTSRKAFQREHQEKDQRQSANGSGKGGTCSGEGQSAGARQSATSWLGKGLQGAQDADKTMKKGPSIGKGKGKTMPIQDPNAILHTFLICVEDSLQAAGNDIE